MGRLTLNVLLSFAQFEREVIGERIRDKIAASKQKGMWMGGVPPLGYQAQDRKLIIVDSEAEIVRFIFRRYAELGSVRLLKDELAARNIQSKLRTSAAGRISGGKPFARGALYLILQNRIYRGEIVHNKQSYLGEHEANVESIANGAAIRMPVPRSLLITATAPVGPSVAKARPPRPRVGTTALSASFSPRCCEASL